MIRIHKPSTPPAELVELSLTLTAQLCRRVDEEPSGRLTFDSQAYGCPAVKGALSAAQFGKCCFCESKLEHVAFGDVEHFRPKAGVRQSADEPELRPGYYWLAYEWSNLYLACEQCNRRHKRNCFPLENPEVRVQSHHDASHLGRERPLFVDPGHDDPSQLIEFRKSFAAPVSGSARGARTIEPEGLHLNRPPLRERRRIHRESLLGGLAGICGWIRRMCPAETRSLAERAASIILRSVRDEAEFAAMSRALLREVIPWRAIPATTTPAELLEQLEDDAVAARWLTIPRC